MRRWMSATKAPSSSEACRKSPITLLRPSLRDFPHQLIIGPMYVQFQIPKKHRQWPLIMVHGGGFTGSCVESTPQGTEGWDTYAVRNNLATFVVDQAGRGRSGFEISAFMRQELPTT